MRDEIYLRKLIADGEGTGEMRRFDMLLLSLKQMKQRGCNPQEASKCLRLIEFMELGVKKQCFIGECCSQQIQEYTELSKQINEELGGSKELMEKAKSDLVQARQIRKNKQEYAEMVREIEELPSRDLTSLKLEEIEEILKNQHERQRLLELKLIERRNHLQSFNALLENFQSFISNDKELFNEDSSDEPMEEPYSPSED